MLKLKQVQLKSFENCFLDRRKHSQHYSPEPSEDFNPMQFALKGQDYSLSKQQLISHLQTPRTHSELDFDNRDKQEDATANKKLCDYSPNS